MPIVVGGTFSPSPSARSCTTLKADVASYVLATNNARALAKAEDFLRSAVDKLNTYTWEWNKVYQSITLVADGEHAIFVNGNDVEAKAQVTNWLTTWFGWKHIIDLGDITTARGTEMYLSLWLRLWGALGTGMFNIQIIK